MAGNKEDLKELANQRFIKFKEECQAAGIPPFTMVENTKLKSAFMKDLSGSYGEKIKSAAFKSLAADLTGYGLNGIEDYLAKMDEESFEDAGFGVEEKEQEEKAESADDGVVKQTTDKNGNSKKEEEEKSPKRAAEEAKKPGRKKKVETEIVPARKSSNLDVLINPSKTRAADKAEVARLKRNLSQLLMARDFEHRQLTLYKQDLYILDAITEYGKKLNTDLTVDGVNLDSKANVLHAAIALLVKELDAKGEDDCFAFLKKSISLRSDDDGRLDKKIEELRSKIREYES